MCLGSLFCQGPFLCMALPTILVHFLCLWFFLFCLVPFYCLGNFCGWCFCCLSCVRCLSFVQHFYDQSAAFPLSGTLFCLLSFSCVWYVSPIYYIFLFVCGIFLLLNLLFCFWFISCVRYISCVSYFLCQLGLAVLRVLEYKVLQRVFILEQNKYTWSVCSDI